MSINTFLSLIIVPPCYDAQSECCGSWTDDCWGWHAAVGEVDRGSGGGVESRGTAWCITLQRNNEGPQDDATIIISHNFHVTVAVCVVYNVIENIRNPSAVEYRRQYVIGIHYNIIIIIREPILIHGGEDTRQRRRRRRHNYNRTSPPPVNQPWVMRRQPNHTLQGFTTQSQTYIDTRHRVAVAGLEGPFAGGRLEYEVNVVAGARVRVRASTNNCYYQHNSYLPYHPPTTNVAVKRASA